MSREPDYEFRLPFSTRSKKNRWRPNKGGGFRLDPKDRSQVAEIRGVILDLLGRRLPAEPAIAWDHEVVVEVCRMVGRRREQDWMLVKVWDLGPRQSSRGWDVDTSNLPETVLDAMQGLLIHDDAQVCYVSSMRKRDPSLWPPRKPKGDSP